MNTTLLIVRKSIPAVFLAVLASAPLMAADDAATAQQSQAYQNAVKQEALQKDLASVQAELSSMRDEMKQLLPADVPMIDKAFSQIDSLSLNEMKSTIASLRAASKSGDLKTQLEQLASAYKNQTTAVVKIKDISGELAARGIRDDITQKLTDILQREVADMDEVARLGQASQAPNGLRDAMQRRYQVVIGDQVSVADDVKTTIQAITDAATNLPEDARKFMVAASGIITQQRLADTAAYAVTLTQNGPFAQDVTTQGSVVDTLSMVIHSLSSDEKVMEQLQDISTNLGQLIDQQKTLSTEMNGGGGRRGGGNISYDLQRRQMDISDKAEAARAELTPLNSQAAGLVQDGHTSMEKVVTITNAGRREDRNQIAPEQQTAINDLDAAKKEIDQQIAMLNASKAPNAADAAADLESLLREVQQAALDESRTAQAAQMPNSPFMPTAEAQKTFHDHVDSLQQRALPISPDAAQAIGESSQQLTTAAGAAQQPAMAAAHVAAAQDLAKAADILAKQLAALTDDKAADAALADAVKKVEDAQKQTDDAEKELATDTPAAANQLAAAQQDVAAAQADAAAAQADAAAADPTAATPTAAAAAATAQANAAETAAQMAAATQQAAAPAAAAAAATADAAALAALQAAQAANAAAEAAAAGDAAAAEAAAAAAAADPAAGAGAGEGEGAGAGAGAGEGQGQGQGQGEGAGSGAGVGQGPGADPGQGDAPGQQMNGAATGEGGQGQANAALAMKGGGAGGGPPGALGNFGGTGAANQTPVQVVSGLNAHDRAAVAQLQNEKPPREFVPQVQQYYKNLADGAGLQN